MQNEAERLRRKIGRRFQKALTDYHLLDNGDKILIGLSGGKDSLLLLETLARRAKIHFPKFTVEAIHIRMDNIRYESDTEYLETFANNLNTKLHIITTSFDASTDKRKSPCFLCSWYRRKAMFEFAQEKGFNKIALGHHQDDIIHTAMMNLFFQGQFSSMPPMLTMDKMPLKIIRPLCLVEEKDIIEYAKLNKYERQIKLCPYEHDSQRAAVKQLFSQAEILNKEARYSVWHALEQNNHNQL